MERDVKVYQVIIAANANDRMYDHFEFFARVNVNAANRLLDGLLKDIRNLRTDPFRYPVYNRPYLPVADTAIYCQTKGTESFIKLLAIKFLWMIYRIIGKMMTRAS